MIVQNSTLSNFFVYVSNNFINEYDHQVQMNLCQPGREAVFKQTMRLKAKQAKLKWCILGVVAQTL